jgi:hypothetical protein
MTTSHSFGQSIFTLPALDTEANWAKTLMSFVGNEGIKLSFGWKVGFCTKYNNI